MQEKEKKKADLVNFFNKNSNDEQKTVSTLNHLFFSNAVLKNCTVTVNHIYESNKSANIDD